PVTAEALGAAFAALAQSVQRETKTLLVVAGDEAQRRRIVEVIGEADPGDVRVTAVGSSAEALAVLDTGGVDCLVLDPDLPDMAGVELLRAIAARTEAEQPPLAVVLYSARDLTRKEQEPLRTLPEALVVKH